MLDPKLTVAVILALALVFFVWGRWRYDVVAVSALAAGLLTGVVPAANAFDGFKDAAVITVALVLILSNAAPPPERPRTAPARGSKVATAIADARQAA